MFWASSPREIEQEFAAWTLRQERRREEVITQAWMTAALSRSAKLPSLEKMLEQGRPKRRQTPAEMKEAVMGLVAPTARRRRLKNG